MTLLSICIPVTTPDTALSGTVSRMLASDRDDFEILIGDFTDGGLPDLPKVGDGLRDARLRLIRPERGEAAKSDESWRWNAMMPETRGRWICFMGADDYVDPDLASVIAAMVKRVPDADALSWTRARYAPPEFRADGETARIATGSRMILPEQRDMMRRQFYWDRSKELPDCHFGAWHGAVRRDLLERTREAFSGVWFEQPSPDIDSTCKTVMLASRMVHWERPLSVQCDTPAADADMLQTMPGFDDFPFRPETGSVACAALAIEGFKRAYGIDLDGWEDNFIAACARDCESAATGDAFYARKNAYAEAILAWRGKRALAGFKPEFRLKPKLPRFHGVSDGYLHFDMAMDDTRCAWEFYRLIDAMLFPIDLLDDKLA